jgi:hypothetical protein
MRQMPKLILISRAEALLFFYSRLLDLRCQHQITHTSVLLINFCTLQQTGAVHTYGEVNNQ